MARRKRNVNAVRCKADGYNFDSLTERDFYLQNQENIEKVHPKYELIPGVLNWVFDFQLKDGSFVDVKGVEQREFILKTKIFKAMTKVPLHIAKRMPTGSVKIVRTIEPDFDSGKRLMKKLEKLFGEIEE